MQTFNFGMRKVKAVRYHLVKVRFRWWPLTRAHRYWRMGPHDQWVPSRVFWAELPEDKSED